MPEQTNRQQDPLDALKNQAEVKNIQQPDKMFPFDGAWMPSKDAALIGPNNFQKLINMRYTDGGIEGITGYTKVNTTTPIATYTNIKTGTHFKTQGRTQEDYVLVQAQDSSGNGRIFENQTAIGSQGDFESTPLYSDSSTNLDGRFSKAPSGNVAYANGEDVIIWGGEESTIGSVFTTTTSAEALPIDATEKLINSRSDSDQRITFDSGTRAFLTVLTTRPAKSFKFYVYSANVTTSTLTCKYWDGSAYAAVTTPVDGTDSGGIALAQTGIFSFDDTISVVKLHHFEERYLYAYQFELSAGSASIYEITANFSMQAPTNIWDGIYRQPIQAQVYTYADTAYEDFSLHVSESSTISIPVGCIMDGFVATNDKLILMFEEKMAGVKCVMLGNLINTLASNMTLKYWDGDTFTTVGATLDDGTSAGGTITLGQTGLISWTPPTDEEKTTLFGTSGYAYEITMSALLTGTKGDPEEVVIDIISGVPAQQNVETYTFPIQYKNKLMLAGYVQGNEGNRIDYSEDNAPDIFNGENSSLGGYQSLYFGSTENITAGAQLYNRFGSNLFSSLIIFKVNELYLLTGDGPLDYRIFPISFTIGCPAPNTLATAEVGFELGEDVARNVAMWVSNAGPMMFDGAVLMPMEGLDDYFDPNETGSVNFDYLDKAQGWFDSTYKEYNILLPTGATSELNTWVVYDLVRKKWFRKDVGTTNPIQCGFAVTASNGDRYIYAGSLVGTMYHLEDGASWAGTSIVNTIQTGDFFPSGNEWDITRLRRLKFVAKRITEEGASINFFYSGDTDDGGGLVVAFRDVISTISDTSVAGFSFIDVEPTDSDTSVAGFSWQSAPASTLDLGVSSGFKRLIRATKSLNQTNWSHSFRFEFTSATTEKGMQPVMWGFQYELIRKDFEELV